MSCGHHHQTNCQEVLLRVYEYLDGEMTAGDTDRIRVHLDECAPCLREFGIEEEVKLLVRRSHPCDKPPVDLRQRVLLGLEHGGVGHEGGRPGGASPGGHVPTGFGGPALGGPGSGLPGFGH